MSLRTLDIVKAIEYDCTKLGELRTERAGLGLWVAICIALALDNRTLLHWVLACAFLLILACYQFLLIPYWERSYEANRQRLVRDLYGRDEQDDNDDGVG